MSKKSALIKYGVTVLVCLLLSVIYMLNHKIGSAQLVDVYRILGDSLFLPGILCIFSGLLMRASNSGAMDGVTYVAKYAVCALIPGRGKMDSYGTYRQKRQEKKVTGYGFLYIVGCSFIAVSLIFLVLFYQVKVI